MVLRTLRGLSLALLFTASPAGARTVELCLAEREFLPVSSPHFEAPGQYLARLAIEHRKDLASFTALPWRRCVAGVKNGAFDGAIGVVATQTFLSYMRFPREGEEIDFSKSLGNIVFVAFRRAGGTADWTGEHFDGVSRPVLYNPAAQAIQDKLTRLGVPKEGGTPQEERMMTMILAGRADIAIGREDAVLQLLKKEPFRDKIEILPRPFVSTPTYLAFRTSFTEENPGYAEAVWNEIGRLREAPGWEEKARHLLRGRK